MKENQAGIRTLICLCLLLCVRPLSAESTRFALGLGEAVGSNILLWSFNRWVTRADYAMIDGASIQQNLESQWVWDQDSFAVNHLGHPYQGSVYYSAARSSGNSFTESFAITALSSLQWELFMETETPSWNDLLVTSITGSALGEMLYRLSYQVRSSSDEMGAGRTAAAFLLSPGSSLNSALLGSIPGERRRLRGYMGFSLGYGGGTISLLSPKREFGESRGLSSNYLFGLEYGDPADGFSSAFDLFALNGSIGVNFGGELFVSFFSEGMIDGRLFPLPNSSSYSLFGAYLHYDVIYNKLINLSSNGIGIGWEERKELGESWNFRGGVRGNLVFLGASDIFYLKYKDLYEAPPEDERRNYSLSSGLNMKLSLSLYKEDISIDCRYSFYALDIIKGSVPEGGSAGTELVGACQISLRKLINRQWYIGGDLRFFHKESLYQDLRSLEESLIAGSISLGKVL